MIKSFTQADYPTIQEWMGKRGFPAPPIQFLPDAGFIVDDCAAGFLYETKSGGMGWVEWVSSNPNKSAEDRAKALDALLTHISKEAKEAGINALFSSTILDAYGKVLERNDFKKSDENVTHYVRVI